MNHSPVKGNNYKVSGAYNKAFCKSIPKETKPGIIKEWNTLLDYGFVGYFKDLPAAEKN